MKAVDASRFLLYLYKLFLMTHQFLGVTINFAQWPIVL